MKIVVDTSVIIAVIANEPERKRIIKLTEGANLLSLPPLFTLDKKLLEAAKLLGLKAIEVN